MTQCFLNVLWTGALPEVFFLLCYVLSFILPGDTLIDVFLQPPTPDLLRVKLLVMECTYLDQSPRKDMIKLARDRGHIHLRDIAKNAHIFSDVGSILLMHFSAKYTADFVHQQVSNNIGSLLKDKVICATVAKEKMF